MYRNTLSITVSEDDSTRYQYQYLCKHSKKIATDGSSLCTPILLHESALESFPFPLSVKRHLQEHGRPDATIQRVSNTSFVICTFQHPLHLIHIRMDGQGRIHCQCSDYRSTSTISAAHTSLCLSKRCIHFTAACGHCCLVLQCNRNSLFNFSKQKQVKGICGQFVMKDSPLHVAHFHTEFKITDNPKDI